MTYVFNHMSKSSISFIMKKFKTATLIRGIIAGFVICKTLRFICSPEVIALYKSVYYYYYYYKLGVNILFGVY